MIKFLAGFFVTIDLILTIPSNIFLFCIGLVSEELLLEIIDMSNKFYGEE